jgi:cold shock CspA family protein
MGRSQETFGKKEKEKQRLRKRKEKEEKMEERKANATKGKSLDDMMAYIDENGNISATPPDPNKKKKEINHETIQLGAAPQAEAADPDAVHTGAITSFFEAKGFGFIKDSVTGDSIFVHINNLSETVQQGDKVSYTLEQTPKGQSAVKVKKL